MERRRLEQGLVHVYTGDGKGKTTAALGLSLRAVGTGLKVKFVQFIKGQNATGELTSTQAFGDQFDMQQYGTGKFIIKRNPTPEELDLAARALEAVRQAVTSGEYDVVVLDEISHAVNLGLVKVEDVVAVVNNRQPQVEVVMTGRNMPEQLRDIANYVSEIKAVKHPYEQGITSRVGIEG